MLTLMIGCSSRLIWPEDLLAAVAFIGSQGYRAVEIWAEHVWRDGVDPHEIVKSVNAYGMSASVHAPAGSLNLSDPDEIARRHAIMENMRAIRLAADIGARMAVVHPGRRVQGSSRENTLTMTRDALSALAHQAECLGVMVAVENMEKRNGEIFLTPNDVRDLIRAVGSRALGLTLDIAHLCTVTDQPLQIAREFDGFDHIHLSDFTPELTHVPLGQGRLDFSGWIEFLYERYKGLVILEGHVKGKEWEVVRANKISWDAMAGIPFRRPATPDGR